MKRERWLKRVSAGMVVVFASYGAAYFLTTTYHRGGIGGTEIHHRIFRTPWQLSLYRPMIAMEGSLREPGVEWHAELEREGAWLPPSIDP